MSEKITHFGWGTRRTSCFSCEHVPGVNPIGYTSNSCLENNQVMVKGEFPSPKTKTWTLDFQVFEQCPVEKSALPQDSVEKRTPNFLNHHILYIKYGVYYGCAQGF